MTVLPHKRFFLYALAAIPFVDCIVDQINNALHITVGPLSLLQIIHGSLITLFVAICLGGAWRKVSRLGSVPLPALAAFFLLGIASSKELVTHGSLAMASVSPYGQMTYWLFFWITVSMLCEDSGDAEIMLRGLAAGALATAFSVFLGLAFGAPNYYQEDSVVSSAGWFDTAKMVTGVLNTGGIVLLYLGRKRPGWMYPLLASVCFVACIVTYARAGSVALGVILLWLSLWTIFIARGDRRLWSARFLTVVFLAAVLLPVVADTSKLFARWADVSQGGQAGSGRATFWKIAIDGYLAATPAEQALGRGYGAMAALLLREYGMDIKHTHNDLLDMLTVGGVAGALWLFFFVGTLFRRVWTSSLLSIEGSAGMAILLNYIFHSQFTGQIWGTDAMSYYMISLTCLSMNARLAERVDALHPLASGSHQTVFA